MTGVGRDAMIELILRNCDYRALDWAERIIDIDGTLHFILFNSHPLWKWPFLTLTALSEGTNVGVYLAQVVY